ncbi:MAG: TonB family protein [Armatimonadota bacterium]
MNRSPAASLPLWIGISVLINCVLVIAASTGLTARANSTSGSERIVLQATLHQASSPDRNTPERTRHKETVTTVSENAPDPADSRIQHRTVTKPTAETTSRARNSRRHRPHQTEKPRPRTRSPEPDSSVADQPAVAEDDHTDVTDTAERSQYDLPESGGPVAVKSPRYGDNLGAGLPGAGRAGAGDGSKVPAGGGAEVITARGSGGSFSVGGIPGASGHGPGLGGSGSGIGVGGSGDGVVMPGAGRGPGMGGQGGSAPLPRKVTPDADAIPGVPRGAKKSTAPPAGEQTSQKPSQKPTPGPEKSDSARQPASKKKEDTKKAGPSKADLSRFQAMVQRKIQAAKSYPAAARRNGQSGRVRVSFSVNPSGQPTSISVTGSSGHSALDSAAVRAVRNAGRFRPFPKGLKASIRVNATVSFTLN